MYDGIDGVYREYVGVYRECTATTGAVQCGQGSGQAFGC